MLRLLMLAFFTIVSYLITIIIICVLTVA